ncbi:helix-turn-helix domain-containing protein [Actinoalloteichus hymeniacidonis]|uniref:Transcriptional regulator n=1 Tax=Actinoalloteichus hymeniacidonis TaxID=340345 RepID=A0AAC9HQY1_9PSEU|nr:MerR family transcriptional regulator [Actinoalloteichus hymeniacidonis]AOS63952.1 putative transcriptional regulator [Actinoalloteichus hymeniacidonis]MBB5907991.1 DNA-binding transcriptional MerR regulator [Actinoalloteichus hymeniacidonis]
MAWSTPQLAELAGTTVKAIRYYHRIGLLEEPARGTNGYKQYQFRHLVRLLRIRRLVDLGVPLSDIATMEESEENTDQALRALDAELAASIQRQQQLRAELALLRRHRVSPDLPAEFASIDIEMSDADRALVMVYSRVLKPSAMAAVRASLANPRTPIEMDFNALPSDAAEEERARVAEHYGTELLQRHRDHPDALNPDQMISGQSTSAKFAIILGLTEVYNPAQLDVLQRIHAILKTNAVISSGHR